MNILTAEKFRHGLRCAECRWEISEGEAYFERLEGFVGEDEVVELVCWGCVQ